MRQDFPEKIKKAARARAKGKCEKCGAPTGPGNPAEVHHAKSDWKGGKPVLENAIVLGRKCCHRFITADEAKPRAKADRQRKAFLGEKKAKRPMVRKLPKVRRPVMQRDEDAHTRRLASNLQDHLTVMANKWRRER